MSSVEILGIDHVEMYVDNLARACEFYQTAMGFTPIARTDPHEKTQSILLKQHNIRLVLTASLDPTSLVAKHVSIHGNGVKDIAFLVKDVGKTFDELHNRGAIPISPPTLLQDNYGKMIKASIRTFGDTQHSLLERSVDKPDWLPNFIPYSEIKESTSFNLLAIDHIAFCVEGGTLLGWRDFYTEILGFTESHKEDLRNNNGGMNSLVVENTLGTCVFPIIEPTEQGDKSQVRRFLDAYNGPGVQHLGLLSNNISQSVRRLQSGGIHFLSIPPSYYEMLAEKIAVNNLIQKFSDLKDLNILVDQHKGGTLFQIFSETIYDRPTFFVELIQRDNMPKGFGSGNIKALFSTLENEEATAAEGVN